MGGQAKNKKKNKPKRKDHRQNRGQLCSVIVIIIIIFCYIQCKMCSCRLSLNETLATFHSRLCFISTDGGFVDLSPQERMKVRMHEKAKKKTAEKYSVQQLLDKVLLKMKHFTVESG